MIAKAIWLAVWAFAALGEMLLETLRNHAHEKVFGKDEVST